MTSHLSTHVLDAALGTPAEGVVVLLGSADGTTIDQGVTDADGRIGEIGPERLAPGVYHLAFNTANYFAVTHRSTFYPSVTVTFEVAPGQEHYHVPLLLSPHAYTTYRGS
ncbi:MAG: hydroxyisourate hydrolase [Nocardioidaceae bacterium]|nr:hydroxyisourate hydrolase [Nocardioidaceae bacterium]